MGQLERYGLYVLVVVIFLILGVAIWGGDPATPRGDLAVMQDSLSIEPGVQGVPPSVRDLMGAVDDDRTFSAAPRERERDASEDPSRRFRAAGAAPASGGGGPGGEVTDGGDRPVVEPIVRPTPAVVTQRRTHVVAENETMSSIARLVYGHEKHYWRIERANPSVDARRMRPGTELVIPELPAEAATTGESAQPVAADGGRVHVVKRGEVMASIARRYYGSPNAWRRIAEANPAVDPNTMREGTRLRIPLE